MKFDKKVKRERREFLEREYNIPDAVDKMSLWHLSSYTF